MRKLLKFELSMLLFHIIFWQKTRSTSVHNKWLSSLLTSRLSQCDPAVAQEWSIFMSDTGISNGFWLFWLVTLFYLQTWLQRLLTDWQALWKCTSSLGQMPGISTESIGSRPAWTQCTPDFYLNLGELLTCGLISRPHNWFSRSAQRGCVPFRSRRRSGRL